MLALAGALIQQQMRGGTPTRVNYSIFVAAFAALTHLYLFPATVVDRIASPLFMTILDALNTIFYLCAGIAMAAQLNGNSCSSFVSSLFKHLMYDADDGYSTLSIITASPTVADTFRRAGVVARRTP